MAKCVFCVCLLLLLLLVLAHHLDSGYGEGSKNWIVYLKGEGWCPDNEVCQSKRSFIGSSRSFTTVNLTGILSPSKDINPDFYNWNRAYVIYYDQASFLGDSEGPQLQFRRSKIFRAIMDDFLAQGMYWVENAILAGRSAGGLATILHCDEFRGRLLESNAYRMQDFSFGRRIF